MTTRPRDVRVEFLYLDRETCERCRGAEAAVESALAAVRPALALAGAGVVLDRVHVDSAATAERVGLEVSPTVRVDGRDVQPDFDTSACDCAGDESVPCRLWRDGERMRERAPAGLVADAVLSAAYQVGATDRGGDETTDRREVTRPVERYFDGDRGCC
jgi:hypothetical protein